MRPDGESRQGRRNTLCIQQHMRTNLRTESGRYGCRSRVICCRISIPPCIRPKKQRTFGSQVPTAASGKNRNSLNIRRADRSYPCGFCGGSLCAKWMALPKDKRQTADQAAAFAKRAVEQNKFQRGSREPYDRIMGWLLSRVGRS